MWRRLRGLRHNCALDQLLDAGARVAVVLSGLVEAGAAVEDEVGDAVSGVEEVVAGFAEEAVLAGAADEGVVVGAAADGVVAAAAVDEVGVAVAGQGVVAVAADDVLDVGADGVALA